MLDPKRHADNRNFVESILRVIPGFHGYLEKEYRRDSDYLARKHLADCLQKSKRGLDEYMRWLVGSANIDALPECERLRTNLDRLISRIRGAVRGYSGVFDFVRVDERLLDKIYDHDMALIEDVNKLCESLDTLRSSERPPEEAVPDLFAALDEVEQKFNYRGDMLQGLREFP